MLFYLRRTAKTQQRYTDELTFSISCLFQIHLIQHTLPEQRGDFHLVGRRNKLVACTPIYFLILACVKPENVDVETFHKHIFHAGLIPFIKQLNVFFACAEQCGLLITGGSECCFGARLQNPDSFFFVFQTTYAFAPSIF